MSIKSQDIQTFRSQNNYTQSDLADIIGVSSRTIFRWENGESVPKGAAARKLMSIMSGEDGSYVSEPSTTYNTPAPSVPGYSSVPLYAVEAAAGDGIEPLEESIEKHLLYLTDDLRSQGVAPENAGASRAKGDSMMCAKSYSICHGDVIFWDTSDTKLELDEKIMVFRYKGGISVKSLYLEADRIVVKSNNPDYKSYTIGENDLEDFHVIGKVFGKHTKFRV